MALFYLTQQLYVEQPVASVIVPNASGHLFGNAASRANSASQQSLPVDLDYI